MQVFKERDLPLAELARIGLVRGGKALLDPDDLDALLSGRRTNMLRLENLNSEGLRIPSLDAKLSLVPGGKKGPGLALHPIYREAPSPDFLTDVEAEKLQKGQALNIEKVIDMPGGKKADVLIEYDPETREFIVTDSSKILVPDLVNNEYLTDAQKERFRKGKEVELSNGTTFRYAGTEPSGLRANKIALIASVIVDGGVSFMLYKGLNALLNKKQDKDAGDFSRGYYQALNDMEQQKQQGRGEVAEHSPHIKNQFSRGFTRTGHR